MFKNVAKTIKRGISKAIFQTKKHSPEILLVAGIAGVVTSTIFACKETLAVKEIVDATNEEVSTMTGADDMDVKKVYARAGFKIIGTYAPSVILGVASIGSIVGSHFILRNRNKALAAAAATAFESLRAYRERVRKVVGVEKEEDIYNGIENLTWTDEDGVEHTERVTTLKDEPGYGRFIDVNGKKWKGDYWMLEQYLRAAESLLNHKLMLNGSVFLNEAYREVGLEPTKAGQVCGWMGHGTDEVKDGYIDLRITRVKDGYFINPNIDGEILEHVAWEKI